MGRRITYRYSLAFKQKVIQEIERGEIGSVGEAQRIYDIGGNGTIQNWVRRFGKNELIGKVVRVEMKDEKDKIKQLEQEKRQLEKALAQAHIKVVALESLIEVAEEHYGVDFKKTLLRDAGLLVKRRKRYQKTTNSRHRFKKYGNLIKDKLPGGPGEQHVSDITYINTWEGYCYLSLITDRYSRKIVGHELSRSLCIEGSLRALEKAIAGVEHPERLIHHSDRGLQYCSNEYVKLLKSKGIKISMTEENHVYENALAERVNGILKDELLLGEKLPSYEIAKQMVEEAVRIYNEERLHMSLEYVTPQQKHLNLN